MSGPCVAVVGGGLAGAEAAWQLAVRGHQVRLYEMRPRRMTPAHTGDRLAELVCSNSLGADNTGSPAGILKEELRSLGSLVLRRAREHAVPAGSALAVDRERFADSVTEALEGHPLVEVRREECVRLPSEPAIIATGPLTGEPLAAALQERVGGFLSFFDAVSPTVTEESIDRTVAYRAGRWGRGEDYINCPMDETAYNRFWKALVAAERSPRHHFEQDARFFEGCVPVEILAERGEHTLAFGPMRPVGLPDPHTGERYHAVVQLRQDNLEGSLYNMVGFQTNLKWGEQRRVFRMIPGLESAEFVRLGVMHRNIYVNAPQVLDPWLRLQGSEALFLAGQLVGVEGYTESTAMGLAAALHMHCLLEGHRLPVWPRETAIGALLAYLQEAVTRYFQPMNLNLGLFPKPERKIRKRRERCQYTAERAAAHLAAFLAGDGACCAPLGEIP
ncbi:MAG: methylenetetrahydrofolate--tRNA-(uracil(54)-C(5))-methyltransferase (FADH(2)-oxidizing) TrmFO [Synergistales bacterium]|nr:methylenetetrahydrofolate--tRNA-(uracil(54)-C(5))-methyltransferase (FADH(2)-oxidizing) TrmFO [Synergistales bacterium]